MATKSASVCFSFLVQNYTTHFCDDKHSHFLFIRTRWSRTDPEITSLNIFQTLHSCLYINAARNFVISDLMNLSLTTRSK